MNVVLSFLTASETSVLARFSRPSTTSASGLRGFREVSLLWVGSRSRKVAQPWRVDLFDIAGPGSRLSTRAFTTREEAARHAADLCAPYLPAVPERCPVVNPFGRGGKAARRCCLQAGHEGDHVTERAAAAAIGGAS